MTVRSLTRTGCLAAAMMGLPALSLAASKPVAPTHNGPGVRTEALDLLKDLRVKADDTAEHAAELQSMIRVPTTTWRTHAAELEALKEDVNAMGQELAQLEKVRGSATPWERKTIDEAAPLLRLMADNTQDAVNRLDDSSGTLWARDYQKYVNNLADESRRLAHSVGQVVKFAKVHDKEKHLESTLGLDAGSL